MMSMNATDIDTRQDMTHRITYTIWSVFQIDFTPNEPNNLHLQYFDLVNTIGLFQSHYIVEPYKRQEASDNLQLSLIR